MTIEAVNQFLSKVSQDQKLQTGLSQAMESKTDRQGAAKFAAQHGYEFTTEELGTQIEQLKSFKTRQAANELNESELEAVAGGACTPTIPVAAAAAPAVIEGIAGLFD